MTEAQRRITPELVRAETAIRRLEKAWSESLSATNSKWERKLHKLIHGLPADVVSGLVALKVLTGEEVKAAAEEAQGDP